MSAAARRTPQLMRDIAVGLTIFAGYAITAAMQSSEARQAMAATNGRRIVDLERMVDLDVEPTLNAWLTSHDVMRVGANYWYAGAYLAVTATALAWLYRRRPPGFLELRRAFLLATAMAVTIFALYPVMPPRLLPELGLADTVAQGGTWGSWGSPLIEGANTIAAMPSVHLVWATWVGLMVVSVTDRSLPRLAALAHVLITTLVVVATANHYLLDAAAGAAVAMVCFAVAARRMPDRVQASDAFFLYVESPLYPQVVGGVAMLDTSTSTPSKEVLADLVRAQLHRLPRFRQRLVPPAWWRRPRWVAHPQLDWDWHIQVRELAGGADPQDGASGLAALIAELQATSLPPDRPRWRLILGDGVGPGQAAAILVLHHALSDGLGTIMQAMNLLEADDGMQPAPPRAAPASGQRRRLHHVRDVVVGLAQLATDGRPDRQLPCSDGPVRSFGMVRLRLSDVRELATRHGVGITDVLLAAVAGAVQRVSLGRVGELWTAVPLLARSQAVPEGNVTAGLIIDLPTDARPEADRLAEVARRRRRLLTSSRVAASRSVVRGAGLLPVPLHAWFAKTVYGSRHFLAIVTNIPGPEGRFSLAGSPLQEVYPIVPLAPGTPLAVGALSWNGSLCISITADSALVADVQDMCDAIVTVLDELATRPRGLSSRTSR
ncbi:MAG TPA: phosphatase PAP2 family protein [Jiangellaceae bacterium]|nr:phosphatase PAP2 family protein [Jiangellaceae bacterium]